MVGFNPSHGTTDRLLPCRPGGSIHVTGVKSLQVHTMISTCVDVDTRRKGPIFKHKMAWVVGELCFLFFLAEIQKKRLILIPNLDHFQKASEKSCPMKLASLSQKRSSKVYEWRASKLAAVVCSTPLTWMEPWGAHGLRTGCWCTCTVLATCFFKAKTANTPPKPPKNSMFNQLFVLVTLTHLEFEFPGCKLLQKSARCLSLPPTKSLKPRFPGKWTWGSQAVRFHEAGGIRG